MEKERKGREAGRRANESHRSVTGVPEGFIFRRGCLPALLPAPAPVRRSFSSLIALAAATLSTTATLIATTTLNLTTLGLTRSAPMSVIALRNRLARPKGAIDDTPINMVVHLCLFSCFPMFGTRNPKGRWRFTPGVDGSFRRRFSVTHGVDGGVSGFGAVRVRGSIRINRIHRGFIVRRAMSVGHRRPVERFLWARA